MRRAVLCICVLAVSAGCTAGLHGGRSPLSACRSTVKEKEQVIEEKNKVIREKQQEVREKEKVISGLRDRVSELERLLKISYREQEQYDERIRNVTSGVRGFLKQQIMDYRNFLTHLSLEDFVGNPLIKRGSMDDSANMVVLSGHPVPAQGQINGVGGYFAGPGKISVKLLKKVGEDYIVTSSKTAAVNGSQPGRQLIDFEKPVIAEKGDLVAFYFPEGVNVYYDGGIGEASWMRISPDECRNGKKLKREDILRKKRQSRKYSLNYYGVFYSRAGRAAGGGQPRPGSAP